MKVGIRMTDNSELMNLIKVHLYLYKNVEIQDIYKLLFQSVFGAEHFLQDVDSAKTRLVEEWNQIQAEAQEPLQVPVSIDGSIVRVNLRRCKAEGIEVTDVWDVFYRSVHNSNASKDEFDKVWQNFYQLCFGKIAPYVAHQVHLFGEEAKAKGFPARHHSAAYRNSNHPAYRVVLFSEIKSWLKQ